MVDLLEKKEEKNEAFGEAFGDTFQKQVETIDTDINTESSIANSDSEINSEVTSENTEVANCVALTVKKDYNLTIVKNVFMRTLKNTWKIALSVFTLNVLKFFL